MTHLNLHDFHDFTEPAAGPGIARRTLLEDPVLKVMLVSLRAGQGLPEHAASGLVTVFSISGRVQFHLGGESCELVPGTLVRVPPGGLHRIEAQEDSRLLVTMVQPGDAAIWNSLAPSGKELDLRPTPRPRRHSTVFHAFDQLAVGESFFIVNDHDPRPLRMQLEEARPGQMRWEYLVQGPSEFRIQVTKASLGVD